MTLYLSPCFRYFLPNSFCLFLLSGCGYSRPDGKWLSLDATAIYFAGVELTEAGINSNDKTVCMEARDEINAQLAEKLPAKIAPLVLKTDNGAGGGDKKNAILKLRIMRCEIDVDQTGGSFTYYLSLPVKVIFTLNKKTVLDYDMSTYEQVNTDTPGAEFEFTFAEPVARTLLLFDGGRLWLPAE